MKKGQKHTAEALANMSAAHKAWHATNVHPMKGKHVSPEARANMSKAARKRGRNMTPEDHARMSEAATKCKTPELRARLSKATTEYFKTHVHPMKGKHVSPEARANMRKTKKQWFESKTETEKAAHYAQLAKARKHRKFTLEHMVRYVLNRAGVDYEPQVDREWAPGQKIAVDVFVQPDIAIEVYGDAWHGNPNKYKPDDLLPSGITAREKWARDAARRAGLERNGHKVIVIWESKLRRQTVDAMNGMLDVCGASGPRMLTGYGQLAAEAKLHLKKLEDGLKRKWYHKKKDLINKRLRERRKNDDEYRKQQNEKARKRLHDNPERRARQNQAQNDKYHNDPDHRLKAKTRSKELYHTDPVHRAKTKARSHKRYREKKAEISAQNKARYEKNKYAILAKDKEKYRKCMLEITSKLMGVLGGTCYRCGKEATGLKIITNRQAIKDAGHRLRSGLQLQYYVDNPDEARKFRRLVCPECV